jgi:nicotinate-nucleotide adenylyltransferase
MNAYYVLVTYGMDAVWLMPVYQHPFAKKLLASFDDRVEMCKRAAARFSGGIEVTRVEEEVGGEGRTIDTLKYLIKKFPEHEFSLIVGSDILLERSRWKSFDVIERMVRVIVINRAGYPCRAEQGPVLPQVCSSQIRELLEQGKEIQPFVPIEVYNYIKEKQLYR